ncbi:hypothetical protein O6H91_13G040500 [Diphasiastrum complanatum]|uniref:Uncharacterized protein n=1 Tax=Diphasiastrum complanatum TaxID=34168 RepID=A0ACC2BU16_DIPCM|nr:hypothetical protein O6H91_13G040500 [Diphasiastrum complanatum]
MLAFPMSDGGCEHLATVVGRLSFSLLLLLPWLLAMEQGSTKKQHSQQPEGKSNIHVYVRVRPLSNEEIAQGEKFSVQLSRDEQSIKVLDRGYSSSSIAFQFDGCIGPTVGQEEMMQKLRLQKLLNKVLEGYSSTVMAYGQTGSGKTFTMSGRQEFLQASNNLKSPTDGLIARAVTYLFGATKSQSTENNPKSFTIKASYFEVYNEQVNDLLRLNCAPREVKWSPNEGFYVADLLLVECEMVDDVFSVLDEGAKNRKMGSHNLNKDSSRSHCVMTLHMDSHWKLDDGPTIIRHGRMIFVDLAGSERLKKTKSSGDMLKETGNINRSLFTLGKVISALAEGKRKDVIPYRESTLTKLLMESLGGSSLALMIACISPALSAIDETMSTLHYASCTKTIVNLPLVNMDEKDKVLRLA